jgi:hypothetical protein
MKWFGKNEETLMVGRLALPVALILLIVGSPAHGEAQETNLADGARVAELVAEPSELEVRVGESVPFQVRALDASGEELNPRLLMRGSRGGVAVDDVGALGIGIGDHQILVTVALPPEADGDPPSITIPVTVTWGGRWTTRRSTGPTPTCRTTRSWSRARLRSCATGGSWRSSPGSTRFERRPGR